MAMSRFLRLLCLPSTAELKSLFEPPERNSTLSDLTDCACCIVAIDADLQFAAKENYSLASGRNYESVVPAELDYQIKRLSHHPSLALWSGCNECHLETPGFAGNRFAKLGMTLVAALDRSRPIWPSSPASGCDYTSIALRCL